MIWHQTPYITVGTTVADACLQLLESGEESASVRDDHQVIATVTASQLSAGWDRSSDPHMTVGELLGNRRQDALGPFSGSPCDHRPSPPTAPKGDAPPMTIDPRTWLEILGTETCWELLATTPVGRLGVVMDGQPEIFPVNFVTAGQTIVFRTEAGSKLAALDANPTVCFEADLLDVASKAGWSVLVKGRAKAVRTPQGLKELSALPLHFWAVGDKPNFIRIEPTAVTGRRIHPHG
jgi:uncharacterized protein